MQQVIDGKKYDTETATLLAEYSNDYPPGDFSSIEEALYLTSKGAYFLAGEGGAATRYSKPVGKACTGGTKIIALTKEEALAWCEETGNSKAALKHFEVEEA